MNLQSVQLAFKVLIRGGQMSDTVTQRDGTIIFHKDAQVVDVPGYGLVPIGRVLRMVPELIKCSECGEVFENPAGVASHKSFVHKIAGKSSGKVKT